uniref:Uncharacterized protein n=1 Tax=Setaria digitata TaxID=48799 RepID=A0A915PX76_9BILA
MVLQIGDIFASYCGEDAIPFSLQALSTGQPVLGCARPSCFGWGVKTDKGARFYRINKKNDGFMRKSDLKKYDKIKITARESQLACCTFDNLKNSWDRGIADVSPGQIVVGGEVMRGDRQYAFDYIANVKKHIKEDGSLSYSVSVRRFWCLPYPTKSVLYVEENTLPFVMERIAANNEPTGPEETNVRKALPQFSDEIIESTSPVKQTDSGIIRLLFYLSKRLLPKN